MIGTTFNLRRGGIRRFRVPDGIIIFSALAFLIGYLIGVFLIAGNNAVFLSFSKAQFQGLLSLKSGAGFLRHTFMRFLSFLPFMVGCYFFGTSILGCAFVPAVLVVYGLNLGTLISYIYHVYALSGMGFTALLIAPFAILSGYILVLAARESLGFSDRVLKNALPHGTAFNLSNDFKIYTIRYIFLLVFCLLAAVLDAFCNLIFFRYFKL